MPDSDEAEGDAEAYLGGDGYRRITTPAYFNDAPASGQQGRRPDRPQRAADRQRADSGQATYGLDKGEGGELLVSDFGGGKPTFPAGDRRVVEVRATQTTTSAATTGTSGRRLRWTSAGTSGIDLTKDKIAMQRLRKPPRRQRSSLSSSQSTSINLPYITVDADKNPLF